MVSTVRLRRGITILELVIVMLIFVIAAALAVPRIKDALEDQQRREATRGINAYITGAQVLAAKNGRPVGVLLERQAGDRNQLSQSIRLYIAEVPPPYSGDTLSSRARIIQTRFNRSTNRRETVIRILQSGLLPSLIRRGEKFTIRFDFKGHHYPCVLNANNEFIVTAPNSYPDTSLPPVNPFSINIGFRYQIFRQPKRSSIESLQLPSNAAVDLSISGVGAGGFHFQSLGNNSPVIIMFSPNGKIDKVYWNGIGRIPNGAVHLMVGRTDQVRGAARTAANANLNDLANFWVSIGHRTGAVTSSNNLASSGPSLASRLAAARRLARTGQSVGGQ